MAFWVRLIHSLSCRVLGLSSCCGQCEKEKAEHKRERILWAPGDFAASQGPPAPGEAAFLPLVPALPSGMDCK